MKVLIGNAYHVLQKMEEQSVDCIVTSPPYWQVRDYGTEPVVWPGQMDCSMFHRAHDWREIVTPARGGVGRNSYIGACKDGATNNRGHPTVSQRCRTCGAWCGQLGLEPMVEDYVRHLCMTFSQAWDVLKDTGSLWVNIGDTFSTNDSCGVKRKSRCMIPERFALLMCETGWILRDSIVWKKGNNPMPENVSDRFTAKSYEMCYRFVKQPTGYYFNQLKEGNHNMRDVWDIPLKPSRDGHPAPFPAELVERMVMSSCPPGGTVLDPFCGSGTTLEWCSRNGYDCIGIELNPDYKPIIEQRVNSNQRQLEAYDDPRAFTGV